MNKADEQAAEVCIGKASSNGGVGRHFGVGKRGSCGNFFAQQYPSNPAKRQKPKRFTKAELKAVRQTRIKNLRSKK